MVVVQQVPGFSYLWFYTPVLLLQMKAPSLTYRVELTAARGRALYLYSNTADALRKRKCGRLRMAEPDFPREQPQRSYTQTLGTTSATNLLRLTTLATLQNAWMPFRPAALSLFSLSQPFIFAR